LSFSRLDEKASDNSIPNWSQEVDVLVASPGRPTNAVSLAEQNSKVPVVLALNVAEQADLELARKYDSVRIISNPGPQFFAESAEILAQAKSKARQPTAYFLYGYVATQVFAAIANSAKDFSGEALSAAAREKVIPTAAGNLKFDGRGDLIGWRFAVWSRSGTDINAVDVCKGQDCKDYDQCPRDCPK
jgi:ABC-type branched-subunit amino acid transport system substrate-binding protein